MGKIQILSIGRVPVELQKLSRFINENPKWESTATVDDETAIEIFHQREFKIILFIDEIENESDKRLCSVFLFYNPGIIILKHVGGSTALLASEIQESLDKSKSSLNIMDDVFNSDTDE